MAKPRKPSLRPKRCPPCPQASSIDIVHAVALDIYEAVFPDLSPEEVMEKFRVNGTHHTLMELAYPETNDMVDMEYGRALDEFEGELEGWLEDFKQAQAEDRRRWHLRSDPHTGTH